MTAHSAYVHLRFVVELDDDERRADDQFDVAIAAIARAVGSGDVPYVYDESVEVMDADTTGEQL